VRTSDDDNTNSFCLKIDLPNIVTLNYTEIEVRKPKNDADQKEDEICAGDKPEKVRLSGMV
jgi:hypothetical protein